MTNIVTINIGDWSSDGHGHNEEYDFEVNYPKEQLQQAYKDSCKLVGVQFNYNDNYTDHPNGYGQWWQIATEYEDNTIKQEALDALKVHGIDLVTEWGAPEEDVLEEGSLYIEDADEFATLIMRFIGLSMPEDFKYEPITVRKQYLNGYWSKGLNCQFGYGLYSS